MRERERSKTHSNSYSHTVLSDHHRRDRDDNEIDDVLGAGEERGDDSGSSFHHEMSDRSGESFQER